MDYRGFGMGYILFSYFNNHKSFNIFGYSTPNPKKYTDSVVRVVNRWISLRISDKISQKERQTK